MKAYHSEFDQTVTVCTDCGDCINEGVTDDRETFHSPCESSEPLCDICGATS